MRRAYELRADDRVIARLGWVKTFGSLAEAECGELRWTFKRGGFLRPYVSVREPDRSDDVAVFQPGWLGNGELRVADGERYYWRRNFWSTRFSFFTASDVEVVRFGSRKGLIKLRMGVEVLPGASDLAELPLLLTLGCYLIVLMSEDSSAVVVVS